MNNIEHPNPTRHADEHWIEDRTRYNEDTLLKVRQGLKITGLDDEEITDLISGMLNEGILFRERIAKNFQT